jgi:DNA-binding beta-propeller fold protein YncE
LRLLIYLAVILALAAAAQAGPILYVSDASSGSIKLYDGTTGAFISDQPLPALAPFFIPGNPAGMAIGPNGNLFVADNLNNAIYQFDSAGNFLGQFVPGCAGSPDCDTPDKAVLPNGIVFGPDGNLYVAASGNGGQSFINRYNGTTGAFIDRFVDVGFGPSFGGLNGPSGIAFGPDGNLYVSDLGGGEISRFDGTTGAYTQFVPPGFPPTPLAGPEGLAFGPDGTLYVADVTQSTVYHFGTDGTFLGAFATGITQPIGLAFGPDGNLYVADGQARIARFNGTTGAFIDDFVPTQSGGLIGPAFLVFGNSTPSVPEPATLSMMGLAGVALLAGRLRRSR